VGAQARRRGTKTTNGQQPLEGFFGGISPVLGFLLGLVFVGVVGFFDHLTGPATSLAPLMLMPVLLVTWNGGRLLGIVMAGVATVATQIADLGDGQRLVVSWNAFVWMSVFVLAAWLLAALKDAISKQERRMGRLLAAETETSSGLREQNEIQNTLLHAVSHDLKGPLAGVLGGMQTIRRADKLGLTDTEMDDLYGVIEQAGAKAARLVDDLLDLDRLDRGQLSADREPTDIVAIARRAARELPTLAGHPVRVDGPDISADVDGPKVERIIDNLLVNAARHTAPGTPIQVEVVPDDAGVTVVVEDQGPGVPDPIKEEIFEAFRQGEQARGGVGIGLSLVRRFAELHGGNARVEDRPGGGARFIVYVPGAVQRGSGAPQLRAV
jgi:signal transduction histidine kinase